MLFVSGPYCDEDVDECTVVPNICQNGATCANTFGSFECLCVNGYDGDFCENNIDDCGNTERCLNGGTCVDYVGSFRCECPPAYTGKSYENTYEDRQPDTIYS